MGASLSAGIVVLLATMGGVYQLALGPVIHAAGFFRQVEPRNNQNCQFVPELEGCESELSFTVLYI